MTVGSIFEILERLRDKESAYSGDGPKVSVNKLTSRAGAMYEKLRYLVEYKDEHTIRRSAIERILKRKLSLEGEENVGMSLLQELVSAEYLPNNTVPESFAAEMQAIVDKYRLLAAKTDKRRSWNKKGMPHSPIGAVAMSLAASEIDRKSFPRELDDLVVESFYKATKSVIRCTDPVKEKRLRAAAYIACRRSLLRDDAPTLLYVLVSKYVPELATAKSVDEIHRVSLRFERCLSLAERQLADPLAWRIAAAIRNRAIGFSLVREIVHRNGAVAAGIFANPEDLEAETKKILSEKYTRQNHAVWQNGVRAAIYIFLTKSILAFLLEVPYELSVYNSVDAFALGVNLIFHPILLLLMVHTIRPLGARNMARTIAIVKDIADHRFEREEDVVYIKPSSSRPAAAFILGVLYFVLFAGTFGAIVSGLSFLNFSAVSIMLFLFFLALVSYFGLRIRYNAMRWKVVPPNESTSALLWNFATLPIVRAGRWLSQKFAAVNIFVFVMDFIIEMPFKIILGTFDSFLSFLKEKEEDMY